MSSNFEYEFLVQNFLVENGVTFLAPQFSLMYSKDLDSGGSKPDFVAIRPGKKECFVVEVNVSGDPTGLLEKVNNREKQWYRALRARLLQDQVIDEGWSIEVLVFIRTDQRSRFINGLMNGNDVHVWPIELVLRPWDWPTQVRSPDFDFRKIELSNIA